MKNLIFVFFALFCLIYSLPAQGLKKGPPQNLVQNASFENDSCQNTCSYFSVFNRCVYDWKNFASSPQVRSHTNIFCDQRDGAGNLIYARTGQSYLALGANTGIFQDLNLSPGVYSISFYYKNFYYISPNTYPPVYMNVGLGNGHQNDISNPAVNQFSSLQNVASLYVPGHFFLPFWKQYRGVIEVTSTKDDLVLYGTKYYQINGASNSLGNVPVSVLVDDLEIKPYTPGASCDLDGAPQYLSCAVLNTYIVLSWDPVSNPNVEYKVHLDYNNSICCSNGLASYSQSISAGTSHYIIINKNVLPQNACFAWRVEAKCKNGFNTETYSLSEPKCFSLPYGCLSVGREVADLEHLADLEEGLSLNIHPNPTDGDLNIKINNAGDYLLSVYGLDGRLVKAIKSANNDNEDSSFSMNVKEELNSGIYFFKLVTDNGVISKKVIVR